MNFEHSKKLQHRSHSLIPGGAHTYAKGDDQYPELAPGFLERGEGCHVWDIDGNEFIEYGMGLRSVTLGINFTQPSLIEVECAEKLASFIKGAEMVKFGKNGSDATSAAVKLACAYTGRDLVGFCAEHPFFSVDNWFIGSTEMPCGIPQATRNKAIKFHYNDFESIRYLFDRYSGQVACLIMEAERTEPPINNFLQ
jgi:glutamate-1-semialdehyde 2,1-aminomutase